MTQLRSFLPALNAVLRSLPQHAGFLSIGLPGSAFERTILALRPDLSHVPALSIDLLSAFPEYVVSLLGEPIPRMVLGPQAGEATTNVVLPLGKHEIRCGRRRLSVTSISDVASGMRSLAFLYVDGSSAGEELLMAMHAALQGKDTLIWIGLPLEVDDGFAAGFSRMGKDEVYACFAVSDGGHVSAFEREYPQETRALILVPDKYWYHERFSAEASGQGQLGRLIPKNCGLPAGLVDRLASLPVAERARDLPQSYESRFGEGVFASWHMQAVEPDASALRLQLQGPQVSRVIVPTPPQAAFYMMLSVTDMPAEPDRFTVTLHCRSQIWPMDWAAERGGFVTRASVEPSEHVEFLEIMVALVDQLSPSRLSLTVSGIEVLSREYAAKTNSLEQQNLLTDREKTCR